LVKIPKRSYIIVYYYISKYFSGNLSLAERDGVEPAAWIAFVSSKLEQCHGGVSSWWQDEDEWSTAVGVTKRLGQIKRRRFNEVLTKVLSDKVCDSRNNLHTSSNLYLSIYLSIYLSVCLTWQTATWNENKQNKIKDNTDEPHKNKQRNLSNDRQKNLMCNTDVIFKRYSNI